MREHPSGRPIRRTREVKRGFWNLPGDGPATPRLRQVGLRDAIGFRADPVDREVLDAARRFFESSLKLR